MARYRAREWLELMYHGRERVEEPRAKIAESLTGIEPS